MPAAPTVVRTMEFRLQPEELGDVRISLHLQGEALRLSVEVVTTEAHALLQRDKRALQDVLEKAGFEIADTAVTITLRPEPMTAQQTPSQGQDAASGQQRGSHGSGSYQPPAGDQSRQDARQTFQEEAHDKSGSTKPQEKARPAAAGGIYL
jgi:flagellar hook-length control protein FliK